MALRNFRVGMLAVIGAAALAGCLPKEAEPTSLAGAEGPPNSAPTIGGNPTTSAMAGTGWLFQPSASDADGDTLTFSATGLPSWMSINANTGLLSGTPGAADVGSAPSIVVTVSDGKTTTSLRGFSLTVSSPQTSALPAGTGMAALSWEPPQQYTDGSALLSIELGAYRIYHGSSVSSLQRVAEVDSRTTAFRLENLTAGTHYFVVTAVTTLGSESSYSEIRSKTIL